jgi:hypothetical protein
MKVWKLNYLQTKPNNNLMYGLKYRPAFFTRIVDGQTIPHRKCYVAITNAGVFVKARTIGPVFKFPLGQCIVTYLD